MKISRKISSHVPAVQRVRAAVWIIGAMAFVLMVSCTEDTRQPQGAPGMPGGYAGAAGYAGAYTDTGGYAGTAGYYDPGPAGQAGVAGVAGMTGAVGETAGTGGAAASGGVAGAAGVAGVAGTAGAAGVAGVAGTAGAAGVAGVAGTAGMAGAGGAGAGGDSGTGGAGTGGDGASGGAGGGLPPGHCMEGITDYTSTGPFSVQSADSGLVNIWVPGVPAGCKVPVVHLSNGTGASCFTYNAILEHLASHGFLASCYEDTNTGQGTQCISALETLFAEYPDLADNRIGSTGHSQGGGASFICIYRAEEKWGDSMIYAGHSMEPASGYGDSPSNWASLYGQIESPFFMFNGSSDMLVSASWVRDAFDALPDTTEAYWYEAVGASHMTPIPTSYTQESAVAWFRWKLLGDAQACEYFKAMPNSSDWNLQEKQNEQPCM